MTRAVATDPRNEQAAAQAAQWYARLNAAGADTDEGRANARAFAAWLAEDAAHGLAWARVERLNAMLDATKGSAQVRALVEEALAASPEAANDSAGTPHWSQTEPAPAIRRWPGWARLPAAAAAMAAMVGAAGLMLLQSPPAPAPAAATQDFETAIGDTRRITLADGSQVTLDAASRLRVTSFAGNPGAERRVELRAGRAFFKVAKDKTHPFVVTVGGNSITALGTAFDVRIDGKRTVAALVEGKIRVDMPGLARVATLSPGEQITIAPGGAFASRFSGSAPTEWLSGQITYDDALLSEVVADMNRHSTRCLVLADPALGERRISGVFHLGDVRAVTQALAAYGIARAESGPVDSAGACIRLRAI